MDPISISLLALTAALFADAGNNQGRGDGLVLGTPAFDISFGVMPAWEALDTLTGDLWDASYPDFLDVGEDASVEEMEVAAREIVSSYFDPDEPVVVIGTVLVGHNYRGRQVGTEIVNQVISWATNHGIRGVMLHASDIGGGHSFEFWQKLGFSPVSGSQYYDDVIMYLTL